MDLGFEHTKLHSSSIILVYAEEKPQIKGTNAFFPACLKKKKKNQLEEFFKIISGVFGGGGAGRFVLEN